MDDKFQDILDGMPEKPPRSSLEPYRELINELRRRGRTYREIAHILAEKCQLRAAASTVNRFVRKRKVARAKPPARLTPKSAKTVSVTTRVATERIASSNVQEESLPHDDVQQRIAALKLKPAPTRSSPDLFRYDPNEPLHLPPKDRKANSGE